MATLCATGLRLVSATRSFIGLWALGMAADDKLVEQANTNPPSVYGFGHEAYYRNVLAVLRGQAPPETDGRAGRKSLELILGIYESARSGHEVPIPLRLR